MDLDVSITVMDLGVTTGDIGVLTPDNEPKRVTFTVTAVKQAFELVEASGVLVSEVGSC